MDNIITSSCIRISHLIIVHAMHIINYINIIILCREVYIGAIYRIAGNFRGTKFSRIALFREFREENFRGWHHNFVSRRCHAILWCEGIESSVLLVAKMVVNEDVYVI